MINYLKGSGSAIAVTMLGLAVMAKGLDSFDDFYVGLIYVSGFGYVFGLLGLACLFLIKKKKYNTAKSYLLYLLLGILCGWFMVFSTENAFFSWLFFFSVLGSLTFLASQKIKSKAAVYTLSALPILLILFCNIYINVQY
jgi:hypothetical protein